MGKLSQRAFLAALLFSATSVWADSGILLPDSLLSTSGQNTCGFVKNKWIPGKVASGKFYSFSDQVKSLQKQLKKAKGKKRGTISGKIVSLQAKIKKANKQHCRTLTAPQIATVTKLSQLPDTSALAAAAAAADAPGFAAHEVSGSPPALPAIPSVEGGVKNLFWRSGVVDAIIAGSATQEQCREFFEGQSDGESGGLGACFMAQGVGYSFQPLIQAGTSLCMMKQIPTQANLTAGGIDLVSGSLPGSVENLFAAPSGSSDRLVKVLASGGGGGGGNGNGGGGNGGQNIFIKVQSQSANQSRGKMYAVDLWFCDSGQSTPRGYERLSIGLDGAYSDEAGDQGQFGTSSGLVTAWLTRGADNSVVFDSSKDRQATVAFGPPDGGGFKGQIVITGTNLIKTKSYDVFGTHSRKGYNVASFAGTSIANLQFLEGSYKGLDYENGTQLHEGSGAAQYRSTYYASAPASDLVQYLSDVNFETDSFYAAAPSASVTIPEGFSCSAAADVVVSVDMTNPAVLLSVLPCQQRELEGMNFCSSETINQAQAAWWQTCGRYFTPPPGP